MVIALVALALAAFTAETLSLGALRRQPRYDEVAYLSLARDYHRMGGAPEVVRCHLNGRCHEDNRFPTFALVLQAFAHDRPELYADAKLITLATALLLLATVGLVAGRAFGPATGVASVLLLALMPTLGEISSGVLADVLYASALFVAVRAIAPALDRGAGSWLGAGALVGLAYLTKGNAHLALLGLLTAAVALHGLRIFLTPRPYAALLGFVAVTFFLLWRNVIDYGGNPFHNFNDRSIWLDAWQDTWRMMRTPDWNRIGLGWYLRRHSLLDLAWRLVKGIGQTLGALIYTSGLGVTSGTPVQPRRARSRRRCGWRRARRSSASAPAASSIGIAGATAPKSWPCSTSASGCCSAFALGGQGVGGVATRFVLPLTALIVPYAALSRWSPMLRPASARAGPRVRRAAAGDQAGDFAGGLGANPRRAFDIPAHWAETSGWLAHHLEPGERYAFPYGSLYSTWDQPAPDPDARWLYNYAEEPAEILSAIAEARPLSVAPRWDGPPRPIRKILDRHRGPGPAPLPGQARGPGR